LGFNFFEAFDVVLRVTEGSWAEILSEKIGIGENFSTEKFGFSDLLTSWPGWLAQPKPPARAALF